MRLFGRPLLIAATLVLAIAPLSRAMACDLQPAKKNPADVPGIEFTPLALQINDNFRSGRSSRRNYDHIEELDGITLGFGHWPQQEVAGFFADMKTSNNGKALAAFTDCMTEFFALKREAKKPENKADACGRAEAVVPADAWRRAQAAAKITPSEPTRERVAAVLDRTLLSAAFKDKYNNHCPERCVPGQPDMFHEHENWLVPALCYALRDRNVIAWQVDFWTRTIVDKANNMAASINLRDDASAVITIAAYRSSSPKWFEPVKTAARTGSLSFDKLRWNWNEPPAGAKRDAEGLKNWRHFILWQHYAARVWIGQKKYRFRDRSRKYFADFLADKWRLPALNRDGSPNWNSVRNLDPALVKPR